ncbi:MAG: Fe-S cluster assembly protein SufD [candidate division KSB1 bacterium]|nr:Fe-S cluster assembly protein SufD [candidate division KSB1 bacterium]
MESQTLQHTDAKAWYLAYFDFFENKLNGGAALPFHQIRREAMAHFAELGFPTMRQEEWKYTNIAPLFEHTFHLITEPVSLTPAQVAAFEIPHAAQNLLVFVNGRLVPECSRIVSRARGLVLDGLANVLQRDAALTEGHLAQYANYEQEPFIALNTAFAHDGAFVKVPRGLALAEPIHLLYLAVTEGGNSFVAHPRNLILIGEDSQVQLIESYGCLGNGVSFNNIVTEIVIDRRALVEHVRLQDESRQAFHIAAREVEVARDSRYTSISIDLGGRLVRNNFNLRLRGEHGEGNLYGFYHGAGGQLIDNHTRIDHLMPNCPSNEHYKGILTDRAHGVFNGKVMVHRAAQKQNQCLLLSDEAVIDTKPQLEIFADDVKCSHGASVGQLDDDAVFYLRSRGIGAEEAQSLLRFAYASEILNRIQSEPVRAHAENLVNTCLRTDHSM